MECNCRDTEAGVENVTTKESDKTNLEFPNIVGMVKYPEFAVMDPLHPLTEPVKMEVNQNVLNKNATDSRHSTFLRNYLKQLLDWEHQSLDTLFSRLLETNILLFEQ